MSQTNPILRAVWAPKWIEVTGGERYREGDSKERCRYIYLVIFVIRHAGLVSFGYDGLALKA